MFLSTVFFASQPVLAKPTKATAEETIQAWKELTAAKDLLKSADGLVEKKDWDAILELLGNSVFKDMESSLLKLVHITFKCELCVFYVLSRRSTGRFLIKTTRKRLELESGMGLPPMYCMESAVFNLLSLRYQIRSCRAAQQVCAVGSSWKRTWRFRSH